MKQAQCLYTFEVYSKTSENSYAITLTLLDGYQNQVKRK